MTVDLHTHTTCSDGSLSPEELLLRALRLGIRVLAITDHDRIDGWQRARACLAELRAQGVQADMLLVPGIEVSAVWGKTTVHVLGLNFSESSLQLQALLGRQAEQRSQRNSKILGKLEAIVPGLRASLAEHQEKPLAELGRPQIAEELVRLGAAKDSQKAFRKYLAPGKPASVRCEWLPMEEAVACILASDGVAVLAHPLQYRFTATRLRALVADFVAAGGQAMEVVTGHQATNEQTRRLAKLAADHKLLASAGSDFHSDAHRWQALGGLRTLPDICRPVWRGWEQVVL